MAVNTHDLLKFLHQHHGKAIEAHLDATLAALRDQWEPARAMIANRIDWLEQLMQEAQDAGQTIDPTWLQQEQRLTTLLKEIDDASQMFGDEAQSTVGQAQLDALDMATEAAQEAMQAALPDGLAATFGTPPQGALDAMASALDEDSPLSQLFDGFGLQSAGSAEQALWNAVNLGQGAAQIADMLTQATEMTAQRAEVIARTELLRTYRDAQMANYRANSDVVTAWMWSASFSERTCGACLAMDGTIHPLDQDLDDHICGRCTALPVTTPYAAILGQLGIDATNTPELAQDATAFAGILGGRQTGGEWLAEQDFATQTRILGPAKASAIYQYGDISLHDLVGVKHDAVWGDSIYEQSLRSLGLNARDYLTTFRLPPRDVLGAGERAAAAEAERVAAASATQAVTQPLDWEAQHVADLSRALGVEPPPLFGRQVEAGKADWQDWYTQHIAPLLPEGYVDPVFGGAQEVATSEAPVASEVMVGDALRAEAARMIDLIDPKFAETGSLEEQMQNIVAHLQSKAAMLADNPDWQTFVESLGRKTYEFAGGTFTPEMQAVQVLEGSWTTTVIDDGSVNVALRDVAQDLFGLQIPERSILPDVRASADEFLAEHGGAIRAYVQATYDQTQQWFADHDISELTLYRGSTKADAVAGLAYDGSVLPREITGAAFSSYSTDPSLAYGYAASVTHLGGSYRSLIAVRVPVDQVFGTPFTSMAKASESEFLLFGSPQDGFVLSWTGADAAPGLDAALDRIGASMPEENATAATAADATTTTTTVTTVTTVTYASDAARDRLASVFNLGDGQTLSDDQVANLAGAPPGSTVSVNKWGQIDVTAPDGTFSNVWPHTADDGQIVLLNWVLRAPDGSNSASVDAERLATQVRQANALGVDHLHMKVRPLSDDGLRLLELGYDAPLQASLTETEAGASGLPAEFASARTVQDLLAMPGGRDWWAENVMNPALYFDPTPGSRSWTTLDDYLRGHGMQGLGATATEAVASEAGAASETTQAFTAAEDVAPISNAAPVSAEQLDAAEHTPLGREGQQSGVNAAFTTTIDDQQYLVKSFAHNMLANNTALMAAMGPPEYQAAAEAASWQIAQAVGLRDTMLPTYLIEYQGERQVVMPFMPDMLSYADTPHGLDVDLLNLSQDDLRDLTLFNYLIGDTDGHYGNLLYDPETNATVGIDHSLSLRKAAATLETESGAGQVWTMLASEEHNPYSSFAWSSMAFDRQQLQAVTTSEPLVLAIMRQFGLDDGLEGVQARFAILRQLSELENPTYMDLYDLAGAA